MNPGELRRANIFLNDIVLDIHYLFFWSPIALFNAHGSCMPTPPEQSSKVVYNAEL
jgi:hypothetical protein